MKAWAGAAATPHTDDTQTTVASIFGASSFIMGATSELANIRRPTPDGST